MTAKKTEVVCIF